MNRYRREHEDPNVAWTLALAVVLASVVLVHWLAHVGALALAGLAAGLVAALIACWVIFPSRKLPRNRVRRMRMRARLRLHPGCGHASVFELWLRWSRVAAARRARRSRPSLSLAERLTCPAETSVLVARAQYNHACRVPVIGNQRYKNLLNAPACRQGYGGAGRPARWPGAVSSVPPAFPWVRPRRRHGRGRRSGMWPGQEQGWREVTAWWCCWLAPLSS